MYYNFKKSLEWWVKDIKDEKAKNDYIKYRRIEKICDYLSGKVSRQFVRKNLIVGRHYRNEHNYKIYEWDGKYMKLLKANGEFANSKFNKGVSITSFTEWVLCPSKK